MASTAESGLVGTFAFVRVHVQRPDQVYVARGRLTLHRPTSAQARRGRTQAPHAILMSIGLLTILNSAGRQAVDTVFGTAPTRGVLDFSMEAPGGCEDCGGFTVLEHSATGLTGRWYDGPALHPQSYAWFCARPVD